MAWKAKATSYLEEYYEEIREELSEFQGNHVKAKNLEIPGMENKQIGIVLKYLNEEGIFDRYRPETRGDPLYEMDDFEESDLERLAEEELGLEID